MSSESSYPRCAADIRRSRTLIFFSLLLTLLALAAPWLSHAPAWLSLLLDVVLLALATPLLAWARGRLVRVVWMPNGEWRLTDRKGREHAARCLSEGILVMPRFIALRWRCVCCGRLHRSAVVGDNCDADARRRLLVRLRASSDAELFGRVDQFDGVSGQ